MFRKWTNNFKFLELNITHYLLKYLNMRLELAVFNILETKKKIKWNAILSYFHHNSIYVYSTNALSAVKK